MWKVIPGTTKAGVEKSSGEEASQSPAISASLHCAQLELNPVEGPWETGWRMPQRDPTWGPRRSRVLVYGSCHWLETLPGISSPHPKERPEEGGWCLQAEVFFVFVFVLVFLGLHPWHTEVSGLGVNLELQLLAYATAHRSTGSLTHWGQGSNLNPHGY